MKDPRQAALGAEDYGQAKQLHAQLHRELSENHEQLGPHGVDEHEAAMRLLEADYPRLKTARKRYERIGQTAHERDQREHERNEQRPRASGRPRGTQTRQQRPAARRRSSARAFGYGFLAGRAHPHAEATGLPGASRGATSLVLGALGGVVGLSIVYDVLYSSEKGGARSAPILFIQGVTGFLWRLVQPVDPLGAGLGDFAAGTPSSAFGGGDFSAAELRAKHLAGRAPVNPKLNPRAAGPPDPRLGGYLPGGPLPNLTNHLTGVPK